MAAVNEALAVSAIKHQVGLQRYGAGVVARIAKLLDEADEDLSQTLLKRIAKINVRGFDTGTWTTARLEALLVEIRGVNAEAYRVIGKELRKELQDLADYELAWQVKNLGSTLPLKVSWVRPSAEQLVAIVEDLPMVGATFTQELSAIAASRFKAVSGAVRLGLVQGEGIEQIVKRVVGPGGVAGLSKGQARTLVRTSVNHTANAARSLMYQQNEDIIKGVQWVATLDSRTTLICGSRDGEVYPLESGPRPPAHYNCRSTTIPITKSWEELGTAGKELPPGERASMNGSVPAKLTFDDFLRQADQGDPAFVEAWFRGAIHKGADDYLAAWRANASMDLSDLVNNLGSPITLQKLAQLEGVTLPKGPKAVGSPKLTLAEREAAVIAAEKALAEEAKKLATWTQEQINAHVSDLGFRLPQEFAQGLGSEHNANWFSATLTGEESWLRGQRDAVRRIVKETLERGGTVEEAQALALKHLESVKEEGIAYARAQFVESGRRHSVEFDIPDYFESSGEKGAGLLTLDDRLSIGLKVGEDAKRVAEDIAGDWATRLDRRGRVAEYLEPLLLKRGRERIVPMLDDLVVPDDLVTGLSGLRVSVKRVLDEAERLPKAVAEEARAAVNSRLWNDLESRLRSLSREEILDLARRHGLPGVEAVDRRLIHEYFLAFSDSDQRRALSELRKAAGEWVATPESVLDRTVKIGEKFNAENVALNAQIAELEDMIDIDGKHLRSLRKLGVTGPSLDSVVQRQHERWAEIERLKARLTSAKLDANKEIHKLLANPTGPNKIGEVKLPRWKKADYRRNVVPNGIAFVESLWRRRYGSAILEVGSTRSRAFQRGRGIFLTENNSLAVVAHEIGHWLEEWDPELSRRVKAFLAQRTAGEKAVSLRKLTGAHYRSDEFTRPDRFINPYMGKEYPRATEILSMGLEMLYDDPMRLAREDPEYFRFIIEMILGEF